MQVSFFLSFEFPTDMNSSHTFADWRLNGAAEVNNKLLTLGPSVSHHSSLPPIITKDRHFTEHNLLVADIKQKSVNTPQDKSPLCFVIRIPLDSLCCSKPHYFSRCQVTPPPLLPHKRT